VCFEIIVSMLIIHEIISANLVLSCRKLKSFVETIAKVLLIDISHKTLSNSILLLVSAAVLLLDVGDKVPS
jgi:hypothetical protein